MMFIIMLRVSRYNMASEKHNRIGQDHPKAKYTDHECALVLALRAAGLTYREIAKRMGMPLSTVGAICIGRLRRSDSGS